MIQWSFFFFFLKKMLYVIDNDKLAVSPKHFENNCFSLVKFCLGKWESLEVSCLKVWWFLCSFIFYSLLTHTYLMWHIALLVIIRLLNLMCIWSIDDLLSWMRKPHRHIFIWIYIKKKNSHAVILTYSHVWYQNSFFLERPT